MLHNLIESFGELERAIAAAKACLLRKENPSKDILGRLDHYQEILVKQRSLARSLSEHSREGNVNEMVRHIKIINALSALIRDDAWEILGAIQPQQSTSVERAEREILPC